MPPSAGAVPIGGDCPKSLGNHELVLGWNDPGLWEFVVFVISDNLVVIRARNRACLCSVIGTRGPGRAKPGLVCGDELGRRSGIEVVYELDRRDVAGNWINHLGLRVCITRCRIEPGEISSAVDLQASWIADA